LTATEGKEMGENIDAMLAEALKGMTASKRAEVMRVLEGEKPHRTRRPTHTMSIPEPYSILYEITCRTCGKVYEQYFNMERDEVRGCLVSKATMIKPVVFTTMKRERMSCANCKATLLAMTKEEVVERFLKLMVLMERLL